MQDVDFLLQSRRDEQAQGNLAVNPWGLLSDHLDDWIKGFLRSFIDKCFDGNNGTHNDNDDHKVDAADYVLWRKSPNTYGGNPAGYNTWRANFGQPPGSGLGTAASASAVVPEPTASFLLLSTVAGLSFLRRSAALSSQKVIRI